MRLNIRTEDGLFVEATLTEGYFEATRILHRFSSPMELGEFLQKGRVVGTPFGQLSLYELQRIKWTLRDD